MAKEKKVEKICPVCKKKFKTHYYRRKTQVHCSARCKVKANNRLVKCHYCGNKFYVPLCRFKIQKIFFCCHEHYAKSLTKREKIGKYVKCSTCGKKLYKYPYEIKKGFKHYYCSINCQSIGMKSKNRKKCKGCGKYFLCPPKGNRRYCSDKCRKKAKGSLGLKTIHVHCDNCGNIIRAFPNEQKRNIHYFCDKKCQLEYQEKNRFTKEEESAQRYFKISKNFIKNNDLMPIIQLKALQIKLKKETQNAS